MDERNKTTPGSGSPQKMGGDMPENTGRSQTTGNDVVDKTASGNGGPTTGMQSTDSGRTDDGDLSDDKRV